MQLWNLFQFISNKVPNWGFRVKLRNWTVKGSFFSPDSHFPQSFTGWVKVREFWSDANIIIFAFQRPPHALFSPSATCGPIDQTDFIAISHQECVKMHISKWRAGKPRFSAKSRFPPPTEHTAYKCTRVSANSPKLCLGNHSRQPLHHSTPFCTRFTVQ